MVVKIALLNIHKEGIVTTSQGITVIEERVNHAPTLHDFHGLFLDVNEILSRDYWGTYSANTLEANDATTNFKEKVKEQIATGGTTVLFCGKEYSTRFAFKSPGPNIAYGYLENYFCSPINLGIVNEHGDTFYVKNEELKYFSPLIKQIPKDEITWDCYFSKLPENSKIIAVNRAGYPVFAEVPIGNGKLVILPRFKDVKHAINILINEIFPQMVHEDDPMTIPKWLSSFTSDYERSTRSILSQIEKAKRLLYTKDKLLKKAVASAFEIIGFNVVELPDGTNADLEIFDDKQKAVVEVKGHENRQSDRNDALQLLGYSTPEGNAVKGIFVSNSEFCKPPEERRKEAFKQGAIELATDTKLSLVSTTDLYEIVMIILQKKTTDSGIKEIREKIMNGRGIVTIS